MGCMRESSALRRHWPVLIFLGALGLFAVVYANVDDQGLRRWLSILLVGAPIAWGLSQYAYHSIDRYRLFLDRLRARLRNPNVIWGMTGEFQLREGEAEAAWKAIETVLPEENEQIASRWGDRALMLEGGVALRISLQSWVDPTEGERTLVTAKLHPTTGTLRFWRDRVENLFIPLLRRIETAVAPHAEPPFKYSVDVKFESGNPYFGYFLARVERHALQRFDVAYFEEAAQERSLIEVREDRLQFVTRSLDAARGLTLRHLVLEPPRGG